MAKPPSIPALAAESRDERAAEGHPQWVLFLAERPEKRTDAEQQAPASGYRERQRNGGECGHASV